MILRPIFHIMAFQISPFILGFVLRQDSNNASLLPWCNYITNSFNFMPQASRKRKRERFDTYDKIPFQTKNYKKCYNSTTQSIKNFNYTKNWIWIFGRCYVVTTVTQPGLTLCFILRAARLSSKLLRQGYVMERLKSSLRKFYGRYGDLIKHYEVSLSQMLHDILGHDHIQWHPQLIRHYTYLRI